MEVDPIPSDDPHMARGRRAAQEIITAFVAGDQESAQGIVKDMFGEASAKDMAALGAATRLILDVLTVLIRVLEDECKVDVISRLSVAFPEFEADGPV